jgi:uncharacterized protein YidB (DUF937 family)
MSRGFPSMTALLGLLAVAGYQNRDKIAELIRNATSGSAGTTGTGAAPGTSPGGAPQQPGLGGLLAGLGGAGGVGSLLGGGLSDLLDRFNQSGQSGVADSWVSTGPNKDVAPHQVEQAVGPDVLDALSQQTGLSKEEILQRLSRELPKAVDKYTPQGRLPTQEELST